MASYVYEEGRIGHLVANKKKTDVTTIMSNAHGIAMASVKWSRGCKIMQQRYSGSAMAMSKKGTRGSVHTR